MATLKHAPARNIIEAYANPVMPKREDHMDLTEAEFAELVSDYNVQMAEIEAAKDGDPRK